MAIDTVRVAWRGINWGPDMADWIRSEWPDAKQVLAYYTKDFPWEGMTWVDSLLGTISLKHNRKQGAVLTVERSLPKFFKGDNCSVLSLAEMHEALQGWLSLVEARFVDWWLWGDHLHECRSVKRLDLCYQQVVPSSCDLFPLIARSLKTRKLVRHGLTCVPGLEPVDLYLTGVSYRQSMKEMARWYDKGLESGNESYMNVIRHEEQIRGGKAGYLLDVSQEVPVFRVSEAIEKMNDRYQGWGSLESYDLFTLVRENGTQGMAAALLVVQPEREMMAKMCLSKTTFYRIKGMAEEARKKLFPVDLRLPETAWQEPMVL